MSQRGRAANSDVSSGFLKPIRHSINHFLVVTPDGPAIPLTTPSNLRMENPSIRS
jgi:hypothetical protein